MTQTRARPFRLVVALTAALLSCAHAPDGASGPDAQRISAVPVAIDAITDDTVDPENGDSTDWRSIDIERPGQVVVQLHWDVAGASFTLGLHDALGAELAKGEPWGPSGLQIIHNVETVGRYYVVAQAAPNGPLTPYSIKIAFQKLSQKACHDCTPGQTICVGKDGYATCEPTADGCNAWVQVLSCEAGQSCREGQCREGCQDQCAPDERRCSGATGVQICTRNAAGCLAFADPVLCDTGQSCTDGRCKKGGAGGGARDPKPSVPPVAVVPSTQEVWVKGEISNAYSEGGQRMLHIKIGDDNPVTVGMVGVVLDGGSDKPAPNGEIKVVGVSGAYVRATTRLESLGNRRRVQIKIK